jgi:hypothetical protein
MNDPQPLLLYYYPNGLTPPSLCKWNSEYHLLRTVLYMSPLWQWQCSAVRVQAATTHGLRVIISHIAQQKGPLCLLAARDP